MSFLLDTFLTYLEKRFRLDRERIFVYDNVDDPLKKIVTYKVFLKDGKKIDLKSIFPRTIIIHKKGECLYTINALNRLIEEENDLESGNVEHRNYELDWDKYQNKLVLTTAEGVVFNEIKRDFSEV